MSMAPNSRCWCTSAATRPRQSASSRGRSVQTRCRAGSLPTNCTAIRRQRLTHWNSCNVLVRAAARVNNRADHTHQPTRSREHQTCGFRNAHGMQAYLTSFGSVALLVAQTSNERGVSPRHTQGTLSPQSMVELSPLLPMELSNKDNHSETTTAVYSRKLDRTVHGHAFSLK